MDNPMAEMEFIRKIFFFLCRADHFVEFDKEGAPEIFYRNGEHYAIPSLRVSHRRLEINELGVHRVEPPCGQIDEATRKRVLDDLYNYCAENKIEVIHVSKSWSEINDAS